MSLKLKFTQPQVNFLHAILGADGWIEDFKDMYLGGKLMSELPKQVLLSPNSSQQDIDSMSDKMIEFEITDDDRDTFRKAFKGWAAKRRSVPQDTNTVIMALNIKP